MPNGLSHRASPRLYSGLALSDVGSLSILLIAGHFSNRGDLSIELCWDGISGHPSLAA